MKVQPDDPDAIDRLRLDPLDVVDVRAERELRVDRDPLLEVLRERPL